MTFQVFQLALLLCCSSAVAANRRDVITDKTNPAKHDSSLMCDAGFTGSNCVKAIEGCPDSPCEYGAICHSIGSYKHCVCPKGRAGRYCEKATSPCDNDYVCQNGGTCVIFDKLKSCICPLSFQPPYCDISVALGKCTNSSCKHGKCLQHSYDVFGCKCDPGYEGVTCDKNINECQSSPCQNGAECTDLVDGYACKCTKGFRGKHCEIPACRRGYCVFGTCRNLAHGFRCDCQDGFKGNRCMEVMMPCESSPCKNMGVCRDYENGFFCHCTRDYTGKFCEIFIEPDAMVTQAPHTLPIDSPGGIVALILGCLVVAGTLLFILWAVLCRQKLEKEENDWFGNENAKAQVKSEQADEDRKKSSSFSAEKIFENQLAGQRASRQSVDLQGGVDQGEEGEHSSMRSSGSMRNYGQLLGKWLNELKRRRSTIGKAAAPESKAGVQVPAEGMEQISSHRRSSDASAQQ
uniref:EGF-like domain-containing protein n=1 Tax=Trichuris muris TaxID=70415 RepID=A0A5S6QT32_TRIMR